MDTTKPPTITRSYSSDSVALNDLDASVEREEAEAISLLRQIFPEQPTEELRQLHRKRVRGCQNRPAPLNSAHRQVTVYREVTAPHSRLGRRILRKYLSEQPDGDPLWRKHTILPHDFLRLPPNIAVRRLDKKTSQWHYELIEDLEARVMEQYARGHQVEKDSVGDEFSVFTRAIFRDPKLGLGMTLCEQNETVYVYSLTTRDGRTWINLPDERLEGEGPALKANVHPGDMLIGVNGTALLQASLPNMTILEHAADMIRRSDDPVVVHLSRKTAARLPSQMVTVDLNKANLSGLESYTSDDSTSQNLSVHLKTNFRSTPLANHSRQPLIHPFIASLRTSGFIDCFEAERRNTLQLQQLTARARQWEETSYLEGRIMKHGPEEMHLPLAGIRKALCVRILNSFLDGDEAAFTIWVYDVESGSEWYAPIRYFRDFSDLRAALVNIHEPLSEIQFPKQAFSIFGSPSRNETPASCETKSRQLEIFLRTLCSIIYTGTPHPSLGEVAMYVQSFLGCEKALAAKFELKSFTNVNFIRDTLKRKIQQYTYRLFLVDGLERMVASFIENQRSRGPRLDDIEILEAKGCSFLKTKAMECLNDIRKFLDRLQVMILEACMADFNAILNLPEYEVLKNSFADKDGNILWETLVREAVRTQIEIEVYVPIRGVVSRWLVAGWRHEDIEIQFKINELRKRNQDRFRLPEAELHTESFASVQSILKEGVGQSTLPCVKLRAIVDAAREITRLVASHGRHSPLFQSVDLIQKFNLGADDFLPIFIFCVVKTELERPCALSVLLQTMCDPINKIGEIGYYLACFEAAVAHIHDMDLSVEDPDDALSLSSVPLNESH